MLDLMPDCFLFSDILKGQIDFTAEGSCKISENNQQNTTSILLCLGWHSAPQLSCSWVPYEYALKSALLHNQHWSQ